MARVETAAGGDQSAAGKVWMLRANGEWEQVPAPWGGDDAAAEWLSKNTGHKLVDFVGAGSSPTCQVRATAFEIGETKGRFDPGNFLIRFEGGRDNGYGTKPIGSVALAEGFPAVLRLAAQFGTARAGNPYGVGCSRGGN
jgi:hypothetical protein